MIAPADIDIAGTIAAGDPTPSNGNRPVGHHRMNSTEALSPWRLIKAAHEGAVWVEHAGRGCSTGARPGWN